MANMTFKKGVGGAQPLTSAGPKPKTQPRKKYYSENELDILAGKISERIAEKIRIQGMKV